MGRFLYFFPGVTAVGHVTDEMKEQYGIARVLGGGGTELESVQIVGAGPNGSHGLIVAVQKENEPAAGFHKDQQTWRECADGAFWLGWEGKQPTSMDLFRYLRLGGKWVIRLGDGDQWIIPAVHVHGEKVSTYLPERIGMDRSGNRSHLPMPQFKTLIQYATEAMTEFDKAESEGRDTFEFTEDFLFDASVEALATLYRVSKWEIGALGLLATDTMIQIVQALCDEGTRRSMRDARLDAQKKTEPALTVAT